MKKSAILAEVGSLIQCVKGTRKDWEECGGYVWIAVLSDDPNTFDET